MTDTVNQRKLVKKLSKSRFAIYEQGKPQMKVFAPVPEKYYEEDEGLAKAVGGGIEAFQQQTRRVAGVITVSVHTVFMCCMR